MDNPIPGFEHIKSFFSVDMEIFEDAGGVYQAECYTQPFSIGGYSARYDRYAGVLPVEWMDYLAKSLGMTRGFIIPPEKGTYFGTPDPDLGITRCMLVSLGDRGLIYLRRTPVTPPIPEWYDDGLQVSAIINDVIRTAIASRYNLIVCGGSGAGKTRFVIAYVIPNICITSGKMLYVETVPEFGPYLQRQYGQASPHRFLTLYRQGLTGENIDIAIPLSMARTMNFGAVVFQEMRTGEEKEWVQPSHIRDLLFSGVTFVVTMHPTMRSPIQSAQYYNKELMGVPNQTIVVELGPRMLSMVLISADGGVSLILECYPSEIDSRAARLRGYPSSVQEKSLREILERILPN